jgi:hypothetical protein
MRPKAAFMFELQNRIILVLYSRIALAKNIRQLVAPPSLTEFSIGPIVQYKQGVDKVLKQAEAAGTVVTEEPHERPWDIYSGYFKYSDDNLWEIVWNPGWKTKDRRDILD